MKRLPPLMMLLAILTSALIVITSTVDYWPHNQAKPISRKQPQLKIDQPPPRAVRQVPVKTKYIALTFDDGPDPEFTPQVLNVLKEHDAFATFFLLGQHTERYPEVVKHTVNSGCEVGVHAYSHAFLNRIPPSQAKRQIHRTYNCIYRTTGQKPALFRPPYGFYNKEVLAAAKAKKLQIILWTPNADPRDFENPGVNKIVSRVLACANPGTIVLLHDYGGDRSQTVEAVDKIIDKLAPKGFRFVTVSQLLKQRRQ